MLKTTLTSFCVALEAQHDLRGSVPPSSDVLSHVPRILLWVHGKSSGEPKITDFQFTISIDE